MLAPGPVSNLIAASKFLSVLITWDAPPEPNGMIIAYEVTYRLGGTAEVVTSITDVMTTMFELPNQLPGTTVSGISVSAYTSVGRGNVTAHDNVVTPDPPLIRELG